MATILDVISGLINAIISNSKASCWKHCEHTQSLTLVYRRGVITPLRFIFRPAKTLDFTIKWVQLIVGSSFLVILAQKIILPTLG